METVFLDDVGSLTPNYLRNRTPDPDPFMRKATFAMPKRTPRLKDFEDMARELLPRPMWDRNQLSDDHPRTRNNLNAFRNVTLRPRVFVDVTNRKTAVDVLGQTIAFPVMVAPAGSHMRAHPDGELATARACGDAGTVFTLSHASSFSIEEVAEVATGPLWFQLYIIKDREHVRSVVERADRAGYKALVVTVDTPDAMRNFDSDDRFARSLAPERRLANVDAETRKRLGLESPLGVPWAAAWTDSSATWKDIAWLRSLTSMPVVVKGVLTAEDAIACVESGAQGLIVSNHGGHTMEDAPACLDRLEEVVAAVDGRIEVFMDGGIRTGQDILKCLALGARAVLVGKPLFWGLAVDGEVGVRRILAVLRNELDLAMAFCGVTDVTAVGRNVVETKSHRTPSRIDELCTLAGLLEKGYLTRSEFDAEKSRLLGVDR